MTTLPPPSPPGDRANAQLAAFVDIALVLLAARERRAVAAALLAAGASFATTVRVLAEPARRRRSVVHSWMCSMH
jgi:hypothetical protein